MRERPDCGAPRIARTLAARILLLLSIAAWCGPAAAATAPAGDGDSYPDTVRVESAIGIVPGHWSLTKQGFRNEYLPDSGFGRGVFSVPLKAPVAIAFRMDSAGCVPCELVEKSAHQFPYDSRHRYAYRCGSMPPDVDRALFVATGEPVPRGFDPGWVESQDEHPRYSAPPSKRPLRFHEWVTTWEVLPGKRLGCGAWFEGEYPPRKDYDEVRGDTVDVADYVLRERSIYLLGASGSPEYLFRTRDGREAWKSTFELAFLPSDYSELERVRFSYVYPVRGGFWLRIAFSRDFEGAGVDEGIYLLELRDAGCRLLAGASETRMY